MPVKFSVSLRPLIAADAREVNAWPSYEGAFRPLDYALRSGGWLDTLPESPATCRFAALLDGRLVGFSILTDITSEAAEIYLAVRPDLTGHGVGRQILELTLARAFFEMELARVHLKVRLWHKRAIALYQKAGFVTTGQKQEEVAGEMVEFQIMELQASHFKPAALA